MAKKSPWTLYDGTEDTLPELGQLVLTYSHKTKWYGVAILEDPFRQKTIMRAQFGGTLELTKGEFSWMYITDPFDENLIDRWIQKDNGKKKRRRME